MTTAEVTPQKVVEIKAQPGPQTQFMQSSADIIVYGGGAGGGKTFALLMEPLRYAVNVPNFTCVMFRRNTVQVRNPGGLWDESEKLYPHAGGEGASHNLTWRWPEGGTIKFSHLEHDKNVHDWQGSQIALICFDELTHFSEKQFWYLMSRNRSTCGVKPYVRATCNPDVDSWVAKLIEWWIDPTSGYPITERAAKLRWFIRMHDNIIWGDTAEELACHTDDDGVPIPAKSLTFIPATLADNRALTDLDPNYRATLLALPTVERERLLGGNWKIRAAAGLLFQREWVQVIDVAPAGMEIIRGWDFAATPKTDTNDPDATSSTKMGRTPDGTYIVLDNTTLREGPAKVEQFLRNTASQDGVEVLQSIPQDPGQAGVAQRLAFTKALAGYNVRSSTESGDKATRFGPFSAQAEGGNVKVLRGEWNNRWFSALEGFPDAKFDDDADSTSRAFNSFLAPMKGAAYYEIARQFNADQAAKLAEFDAPDIPHIPAEPVVIHHKPSIHKRGTRAWLADQEGRTE